MHHLVTIVRPDDDSTTELLVDALWRAGAVGVEEIDRSIRAAFTVTATATSVALRHGGRVEDVADTTGLDSWRDHAADYRAGRFHVRPPWIGPDSSSRFIDLVIDPGHAFGSGSHPTTRLMLTALAEHIGPGDRVVDLGTGSGILAIAAARLGADVLGIELDVRDRTAMVDAARQVEERFGPVHLLCNNAGVGAGGPLQEASWADWDWTLGVNLEGVVNGLQAFLPGMVAHGQGGHVVNTASMAGIVGVAGMGIYNASKFAVVGLSE
ncbi:MAG: SDR family NAD(P)-dependent oxidoreductase, partial [Acidimicrobiales bacterium]